MSDRRRSPRTRSSGLAARVRPGHRVQVVDVSAGGALLDAHRPLRPGTGVEVQFERATHRLRISGIVVRCGVSAIDPQRGPTYRAAIAFDDTFEWAREATTRDGYEMPDARDAKARPHHRSAK
jgi:PilZ domain